MAPSTFAFAAAADHSTAQNNASRVENGDWSRRTNGATQTFRRPSAAQTFGNSNSLRASENNNNSSAKYMPPYRNSASNSSSAIATATVPAGELRYSKAEMLDVFKTCQNAQDFQIDSLSDLFIGGWDPYINESNNSRQRRDESGRPEKSGTDICWDETGFDTPLGATPMTDEEKTLFSCSVNSQLKSTASRDSSLRDPSHRHGSMSAASRGFGAGSSGISNANSSNRPSGRRNENTDPSSHFANTATSKDDPLYNRGSLNQESYEADSPWNVSRNVDERDGKASKESVATGLDSASSWGTGLNSTLGGSAMGAFGLFGSSSIGTLGEKRPLVGGRSESRFKGVMSRETPSDDHTFGAPGWRGQRFTNDDNNSLQGSAALSGGIESGDGREHSRDNVDATEDPRGSHNASKVHGDLSRSQHLPHGFAGTMSPTNTDPYDHAELTEHDLNGSGREAHLLGLGSLSSNVGTLQGSQPFAAHAQQLDRSQNSSVNQQRPFGGFSGLGGLSGLGSNSAWGSANATTASSVRERAGFGADGSFGSSADVPSPSLAGLGPSGFFGAPNPIAPSSARGSSRLGPIFNSNRSSQDIQRLTEDLKGHSDQREDDNSIGLGRDSAQQDLGQADLSRDADHEHLRSVGDMSSEQSIPNVAASSTAQHRTMVMPDRMRWIYRDPQGNTQGPWSGLEMHDWYKAGFFSPELLVKKYEDTEYEPLAQLIRRIGNSREPFLVPQIGIPHGAPAPPSWNPVTANTSGAQPPFANNFPSFGTTLTADQQNALERRKQEEQYLMARQKEHLAQQQLAQRLQIHGQHQMLPHQVPHATLHVQPGMPSTGHYQASPMSATSKQGFYDAALQGRGGFGHNAIREQFGHGPDDDIFSGAFNDRFSGAGLSEQQLGSQKHAQQVKTMTEDRERLQQEQAQFDQRQQQQQQAPDQGAVTNERLQEFQKLNGISPESIEQPNALNRQSAQPQLREQPSLTEQVQQAVSSQQSPSSQSPWAKIEPPVSQTAPPASPLPAPAAQRNRQHVADTLNAESRSRSQTGSLDATNASLAPWAKESNEASKGPSLKEIQEAERKTAAKAEAIAAEARRAALERETLLQAQAAAAAAPNVGLPSSSTWAKEAPGSALTTPMPWPMASKPATSTSAAKSMAQIQKEEEARKKRLAAAALAAQQQSATGSAAASIGKRYAELAGKGVPGTMAGSPQSTGSWTVVAASGKAKTPAVSTPASPGGALSPVVTSIKKAMPVAKSASPASGTANAREAVTDWAINELRSDLMDGVYPEEFVRSLDELPADVTLVTEAVHGVSKTIGSRQFATEYLRRRKLADKGVFEGSSLGSSAQTMMAGAGSGGDGSKSAGGWSEVAKKGVRDTIAKDDGVMGANFKVVAGKKKGGKR